MSHPLSDEDPGVVDERKQKRMLSNRESARRSRLKKQHHLDEMRQQVAQLRAENSEMSTRYNMASRHYTQLTEENRVLRSHAMELSRQLQRLHHAAAAHGHPMNAQLGLGSGLGSSLGSSLGGGLGSSHMDPLAFSLAPPLGPPFSSHHMAGRSPMSMYPYALPPSPAPEVSR
ncbi:unnamed protein product [Closterium sp. Naga37s-1]|nr:unnamed protein product [Closterium sp. Naga37s-1]